jgi:hypothetical protein
MKFINFDFHTINRLIAEKESRGINFNFINANDQVLYKAYMGASFAFNSALILCLVLFYISFYYLLKKLGFNRIVAYFSLFFLTTNIYLAYWTTPSDKMLDMFITLSFLTFLVFITKKGGKKYFWLSAIFGALAVLSKISALFLLPFYFFISAMYSRPLDKKKIFALVREYLKWFLIFVAVSIIFLPTIVFHPVEVYNLIFRPSYVYETSYAAVDYFTKLFRYIKLLVQIILLSNLATASSLAFLAFVFLNSKKKTKDVFSDMPKQAINIILIFAMTFMFMVITISKNQDIRFMSPVFTALSIISGVGVYGVIEVVRKKIHLSQNVACVAMLFVMIFANLFSIFTSGVVYDAFMQKYFHITILEK